MALVQNICGYLGVFVEDEREKEQSYKQRDIANITSEYYGK